MSNIYIQEPPTNGKVVLTTTVGDIDVELWSREAPKACRNFVQLCMESYFNGTIFHRVIKDFIAQGGDPTGTGEGGESIFGKTFKDEIHTRLRFVRRGLVAMANAGKDDNGSQFFFTLGPTQELQGKHTIFGKVTGDTIYNLIKFNDLHTDDNDRPVEPPKIKKTEVLSNPFDDIIPRETIKHEKKDKEHKKKKSQSKGTKDFKLLSFGAEAEEDEEMTNEVVEAMRSKGKSAHDIADDPRLSSVAGDIEVPLNPTKATDEQLAAIKQKLQKTDASADKPYVEKKETSHSSKLDELKRENEKLKKELKSSKKTDRKEPAQEDESTSQKSQAVRDFKKEQQLYKEHKKKLPKKGNNSREDQTMALLSKFKSKLSTVNMLDSQYEDDVNIEDETDEGWMTHSLDFGDAHGKVLDANVTDVDRYEIYDPRNPMTKRRNEEAKEEAKRRRKEKNKDV